MLAPCNLQEKREGLLAQLSALAAPGSRLCFDALHADYVDGRSKCRGFTNGSEVSRRLPGAVAGCMLPHADNSPVQGSFMRCMQLLLPARILRLWRRG